MFFDEKTADVCFEVSSEDIHGDVGGEAASSPVPFHAHTHSFILKVCAPMPMLASLFLFVFDSEMMRRLPQYQSLVSSEPAIFRHMLHYVYGCSASDGEMKTHAKDNIINAAEISIPSSL